MQYAKTLVLNKKYAACDALLSTLDIIPFEGATDGRKLYHESKLMQAVTAMKNEKYKNALKFIEAAKTWPVNLGVGKPYQNEIDERLENWLSYTCYNATGNKIQAQEALQRIMDFTPKTDNTVDNFLMANHLVTAWALERMNKKERAIEFLNEWKNKNPSDVVLSWVIKTFNRQPLATAQENINNETVRILNALIANP
jgi:tetratricopeptide (TPR) repeat protein